MAENRLTMKPGEVGSVSSLPTEPATPAEHGLTMFRVPVVMFTETQGVDERDAAWRAEAMLAGTASGGSRWREAMRAMKIHGVVVVGVRELNSALRNHEFVVQVNDMGPTFRGRK